MAASRTQRRPRVLKRPRDTLLPVLDPGVLGISWGELAVLGFLVALLVTTGRVATFVRGVRRGIRDDVEGIQVRFVDQPKDEPRQASSTDSTQGRG
jgi:Sec-independent protein translocase protein TatA